MIKITKLLSILCLTLVLGSCATSLKADIAPKADLDNLGKIYVVRFEPDKRGLNKIFAEELKALGYNARAGESESQPKDTDTLVTYQDHWMWDITNYMISIDVQFYSVKKGKLIANIHNMRTSLVRKTPRGMIRGALFELFGIENPDDIAQEKAAARTNN
jgi:hypothetical protein